MREEDGKKGRETTRTRMENEDGERYRSRGGAVAPRTRRGIEQVEERKEGVRALRGARAARAGERMRDASENERTGRNKDGGDRAPRARAG